MWTMSHLWKCVLLWCLLIFPEIVSSLTNCQRAGDCHSGYYCHTGSELCMSCSTCSDVRRNLHLCEKECVPMHAEVDSSANSKQTIVVIVTTTVSVVLVVAIIAIALICWHRRCRAKNLPTGIPETGDDQSRMGPTSTLPLVTECASPDEPVNHHSSLLPIITAES